MKENKIRIIAARGGEQMKVEEIDNTLEAMQRFVGGHIEAVPLFDKDNKIVLICNEEGRIMGLPDNRGIAGDFFLCSVDKDEFTSITPGPGLFHVLARDFGAVAL